MNYGLPSKEEMQKAKTRLEQQCQQRNITLDYLLKSIGLTAQEQKAFLNLEADLPGYCLYELITKFHIKTKDIYGTENQDEE